MLAAVLPSRGALMAALARVAPNAASRSRSLVAFQPRAFATAESAEANPREVTIRIENGATVLSLGANGAPGVPRSAAESLELKQLAAQFDRWNAALQTRDPEKVASLYAPDGILLPTVSNRVRTNHEAKVDYFKAFLKLKPFGTINQSHVRFLTPERNVGANSGVYTFDIEKDNEPQKVQARYSFVYRKIDGDWKIAEHHSSAMPEPVAEPLQEVAAQFDRWNAALQTLDPEQVASLYAPDGVLLPTVSNKVRTNHHTKVDYFSNFLQLRPYGTIKESHVRFLNPEQTLACNSGVYTFDIVKDGQPQKVQARYSFVYRKIDGDWKIAEHHSSAMPEPVQFEEDERMAA